jgi:hypothetical protein
MRFILLSIIASAAFLHPITSAAQDFMNNDLEGVAAAGMAPPFWEAVPHTDPVCLATVSYGATPDLTGPDGPTAAAGIMGNPYSGNTFVSGLRSASTNNDTFWHEGIQQLVSGFTPGEHYAIGFYQTVVKQSFFLDSTGSWAVYLDTTLIGVSEITTSGEPFISLNMPWEYRSIQFMATATSHLIKFLPDDDDDDDSSEYGKLRMGLDSVFIYATHPTGIRQYGSGIGGIHPNPASSFCTIVHGSEPVPDRLEVIDLSGRLVHVARPDASGRTRVNVSGLGSGSYLVHVVADDRRSPGKRLVIAR